MMYNDNQLFQNAYNYAKNRKLKVQRQELLGHGSDGAVWKSSVPSAIKALYRKKNFEAELDCYRRLKAQNITTIHVFCTNWTLSFKDVLEFSTHSQEKLDVEKKVFHA